MFWVKNSNLKLSKRQLLRSHSVYCTVQSAENALSSVVELSLNAIDFVLFVLVVLRTVLYKG